MPTAAGRARLRLRPVRVSERALAAQVYRDVGGDLALLTEAADRLAAMRKHTVAQVPGAGLEGRLAVALLVAVPIAAGLFRSLRDPAYVASMTDGALGWLTLGAAVTLVLVGGLWLRRVTKPPFTWRPGSWRAHAEHCARGQLLAEGLDRACLYAVAGLELEPALRRALPDDQHPAVALLQTQQVGVGGRQSTEVAAADARGRLVTALTCTDADAPAPDLLAAARARLHADSVVECNQQAYRMLKSALVPVLVCLLPATLLLGLVAWP